MSPNALKKQSWFRQLLSKSASAPVLFQPENGLYPEPYFRKKLVQERKRAERSNKPLIVMLVDATKVQDSEAVEDAENPAHFLAQVLNATVRDTDICGQMDGDRVTGVILTEVEPEMVEKAKEAVTRKIRERLVALLPPEVVERIVISFRTFPESEGGKGVNDVTWYPDAAETGSRGWDIAKRSMDVLGSIVGLILFSPFFITVPILIKLTSKGPVFFRQERVGRNGKPFQLLKFRSMYLNNDDLMHRKFVESLIRDKSSGASSGAVTVYKIQGDPRVTPLGRFLRKYSIDEFPQFFNVLKGEMSLVGPRPPILYEVENYFPWQRRRVMGRKPGITGLWQVTGRSTTSFDEMVRLDLRYIKGWSVLVDVKILLKTPVAVIRCKGAY
ncbi:sugar transferase [Geomonas sp. RF6]|uniref:sugar transferase n=1 Tax=Geomonas sp. RF6 TaxID=2897342 RepID=UPI001E64781F|nr:sugar transferase [Geomonas sp. RF6]UFS71105.1 sugar transferase [Geomonas sp. RF6]